MDSFSTSSDLISSDKIEGTSVYNPQGSKLGSIDDLVIDKHSGQVRYAVLEFGGFMGMGTERYPMPWSTLKYDTDKGGYVAPLDEDRLANAPKYEDGNMPAYSMEYNKKVNGFYGVDW